jgi:hypothetical protein
MAPRPQAAPSAGLRRTRPDDHAFVPAGAQPAATAASSAAAATAESRNGGTEAASATPQEALVKISTRIPPAVHRFIKVVCAEEDLTTQGIAVDALNDLLQMLRPLH